MVKTSGSAVSKRDKAGKRGGGSSSRKKSMPRAQHAKPSGARTPGGGRPLAMVPKLDSGSSGEDAGSAHVVGGREALGMPSISSAALLMDARPDLTLFADDYLDEVRNALGGCGAVGRGREGIRVFGGCMGEVKVVCRTSVHGRWMTNHRRWDD